MKRTCIVAAALIALTSLYFGVPFRTEAAGTGKELDEIVFYMERGASVRMAEGTNGLRFSASMSKSDYEALESDPSFEEIEYGMIICPYDYIEKYGPINEENVFGKNSVYTDKDDGSGVRIMRLYSDTLVKRDENTVSFNGAIVNVLKENYLREFYGAGYIAARRGGVTHYKFAVPNDNARSVVYVAQRAIEKDCTEEQRAVLSAYVDEARGAPCEYTVNRYFEEENGFRKETERFETSVGEEVSAEAGEYAGYTLNEKQSALKGVAYANDRTSLDLYYYCGKTSAEASGYEIDLSADNVLDTSALFGNVSAVNGISVTEQDGKVLLRAADLAAEGVTAGEDRWIIKTDRRTYTAPVAVYDKIIYSFADLSALNENPTGRYLLGCDLYADGALCIETFGGLFDGGGHCIYDIACESAYGLFKNVDRAGTIRNLILKNVTANGYAAFAYSFSGTAENVFVESLDAKYMFYQTMVETAKIGNIAALLKNGIYVIRQSYGAGITNGFAYLGSGASSGGTDLNFYIANDMTAFIEAARAAALPDVLCGENYVKAFDTYLVTL